jgi:CheY-like chemotaxis protein
MSETPNGSGRKFALLVEDEPVISMVMEEYLTDLGFIVLTASDGLAALNLLRDNPSTSLLVTDISLPGMTGESTALAARDIKPNLPILFATGNSAFRWSAPALSDARVMMVAKPVSFVDLSRKVASLMELTEGGG